MSSEKRTVYFVFTIFVVIILACVALVWIGYSLLSTGGAPSFPSLSPFPTDTPPASPAFDEDGGVAITAVYPNSPAQAAGLQPSYIILAANNIPVNDVELLQQVVAETAANADIVLILLVDGEIRQTTAVRGREAPYLGIEIVNRDEYSTPSPPLPDSKLTVASIFAGSPAEQVGLQVGDVITAVNVQSIQTQEQLVAIIASNPPGTTITLSFQRGNETITRSVTLTANPNNPANGFLGIALGD